MEQNNIVFGLFLGVSIFLFGSELFYWWIYRHWRQMFLKKNAPKLLGMYYLKVKSDHRSKFSNLSNWKEEAWKKSGLQRDSNPWPPRIPVRCIAPVFAEVTGSNPVEALIFFRLLLSNCLNWKIYCDDHSSLSSTTAVQIWIISYKTSMYYLSVKRSDERSTRFCSLVKNKDIANLSVDTPFFTGEKNRMINQLTSLERRD